VTCYVSYRAAYAMSMTSVRLSVSLVDCDHILQQKVNSAHGTIVWCLGYMRAECDPDCNIL